jgi:hypothetical protein
VTTLSKSDRNALDKAVQKARDISEEGARKALISLGVSDEKKPEHLSDEQAELRRRVRVVLRRLGTEEELIRSVAYEQWHRMLFARFLIENDLLIHPEHQVSVSFEDLVELAHDEQVDPWELAARYASDMLPGIFKQDDPLLKITYAPEDRNALRDILAQIPGDTFRTSDALGWTYQFWQTKKKDEVNKSGVKIGAAELPSQTQLFTEPYMVHFLLDNSLGAWWAGKRLKEEDLKTATSEEELRQKASLPGVPLTYLRFVQDENGVWTPASGTFSEWPDQLSELKMLDPCCGSGHFLVATLLMLVPMRMEMEGLSAGKAVDAVLSENLHGLEIDERCVEIAAFALALAAWTYPDAGGYHLLPDMPVACSGLAITSKKEEWVALAGDNQDLAFALDLLYDEFAQAPVLGSLIDPMRRFGEGKIIPITWDQIAPMLDKVLATKRDEEREGIGVVAHGLARAAGMLAGRYHLIATNVPYLVRLKQHEGIKDFCANYYPLSKNDLATVFLEKGLEFCKKGGTTTIVIPQNWLFLSTYSKLRINLLNNSVWNMIARLGPKGFHTPMWDFNIQLLIISKFHKKNHYIEGLDVSKLNNPMEKEQKLITGKITKISQRSQIDNPDARISFDNIQGILLEKFGFAYMGQRTGDGLRFIQNFWEQNEKGKEWVYFGSTVEKTSLYSGNSQILLWENGEGQLAEYQRILAEKQYASGGWKQGWQAWDKIGVRISQMNNLPVTIHCGPHYDNNTATFIPYNPDHLTAIWCYCSSSEYHDAVRQIDQSLKVTNATLVKVPFDLEYWTKVAAEKYPNGLPKPYSSDPTQWIFHGHPANSDDPIQVAVAKLLKYQWPAELDPEMELSDEQREWVEKAKELQPYVDDDGILCLPPVKGETKLVEYVRAMLAAAFPDWSIQKEQELLIKSGYTTKEGAVKGDLELYLRDEFFTAHCKLFHQRPFIWQIWDGRKDGFSVLVNYHLLDRKALEKLIYSYLGAWIAQQREEVAAEKTGAELRLKAAEDLKKKLILILNGESPYDIYVRWKPLHEQPIGWEPDLNDGVRMNIRPFVTAGVLRSQPKINWNKDRGKDPVPNCSGTTDRLNDLHFTLAEKLKAREEAGEHG